MNLIEAVSETLPEEHRRFGIFNIRTTY